MRSFLLFLLFFPLLVAAKEIYRSTGADGVPLFSDREQKGAEKIEIESLPTTEFRAPAPSTGADFRPPAKGKPAERAQTIAYRRITIENPADDAVVWATGQPLAIFVTTDPPFEAGSGYSIGLRLDGKLLEKRFDSGNISLEGIDRGTHTLQAVIFDPMDKVVVASPLVTFHLKRHSILHPR